MVLVPAGSGRKYSHRSTRACWRLETCSTQYVSKSLLADLRRFIRRSGFPEDGRCTACSARILAAPTDYRLPFNRSSRPVVSHDRSRYAAYQAGCPVAPWQWYSFSHTLRDLGVQSAAYVTGSLTSAGVLCTCDSGGVVPAALSTAFTGRGHGHIPRIGR